MKTTFGEKTAFYRKENFIRQFINVLTLFKMSSLNVMRRKQSRALGNASFEESFPHDAELGQNSNAGARVGAIHCVYSKICSKYLSSLLVEINTINLYKISFASKQLQKSSLYFKVYHHRLFYFHIQYLLESYPTI